MAGKLPREELPKAAAAAAAAGAVAVAGKLVRDKVAKSAPSRAYRFKDGEPLPDGVRRVATGRIDHALDELKGKTDSSPEEAVHTARKDMKKLRSLLRLVRGELGDEVYRRENDAIRDAGRRLSGMRDADVMLETLDKLAEEDPERVPAKMAAGMSQALRDHNRALEIGGAERKQALADVAAELEQVRGRVEEWPLEREGFGALRPGLRRAYRRGSKAMEVVRDEPTVENLHEWRKRVKDLWYHQSLLECAWPGLTKPVADEVHELSNLLGDDHDLAMLYDWADAHPAAAGDVSGLENFGLAVERKRAELQRQALALGSRLYAEKPKQFAARQRSYWKAWREAPARERMDGESPVAAAADRS